LGLCLYAFVYLEFPSLFGANKYIKEPTLVINVPVIFVANK